MSWFFLMSWYYVMVGGLYDKWNLVIRKLVELKYK